MLCQPGNIKIKAKEWRAIHSSRQRGLQSGGGGGFLSTNVQSNFQIYASTFETRSNLKCR